MALMQDRYIKITTGKGTVSLAKRNLQTLVFTDTSASTGTSFTTDVDLACNGINDVETAFGTSSKEYLWAAKYFGFANPNGNTPTTLTFAKIASGETPKDAFVRVSGRTNNFGSFCFLSTVTEAQAKDVADANKTLDYRFQFIHAMDLDTLNGTTYKTEANPVKKYRDALVGEDGTTGTLLVFQKKIALSGSDIKVPKTYLLAAVLSSIDWDQDNGTVSPMFRTFSNEVADVIQAKDAAVDSDTGSTSYSWTFTEVGADTLDTNNISYYGRVQINGVERGFFQKGVNSDSETALVYMGEVWLKSEISTNVMELMLSSAKIKASTEGNAKVYAAIDAACAKGVANGVIEVGKTLDTTARGEIYAQSRDAEAADIIEARGYWLKSWIDTDDDGKNYKAKYLLLYSKEDVVVKVEGSDVLY